MRLFTCLTLAIVMATASTAVPATPARVDKSVGSCAFCGLAIVADKPDVDNVVWIEVRDHRTAYRCVLCAMAMAGTMRGDLTVLAPSNVKSKPVRLVRHEGKWSAIPSTAVFVYDEGSHSDCQVRYRALVSADGYAAYVKEHSKAVRSQKPFTLEQLLGKVK